MAFDDVEGVKRGYISFFLDALVKPTYKGYLCYTLNLSSFLRSP
jgi:hypothetical protein